MYLKTFELKKRRKEYKRIMSDQSSIQIEKRLLIEIKDKLSKDLQGRDAVMYQVSKRYIGEFQNILMDSTMAMYTYEQLDETKYIFRNKVLDL